jgi:hypothetical protein
LGAAWAMTIRLPVAMTIVRPKSLIANFSEAG